MSLHFSITNRIFTVSQSQMVRCMGQFKNAAEHAVGSICHIDTAPVFPNAKDDSVETLFQKLSAQTSTAQVSYGLFHAWDDAVRYNVRLRQCVYKEGAETPVIGYATIDKTRAPKTIFFDLVRHDRQIVSSLEVERPFAKWFEHRLSEACEVRLK